jgi:hypothetical protein
LRAAPGVELLARERLALTRPTRAGGSAFAAAALDGVVAAVVLRAAREPSLRARLGDASFGDARLERSRFTPVARAIGRHGAVVRRRRIGAEVRGPEVDAREHAAPADDERDADDENSGGKAGHRVGAPARMGN